MLSQLGYPHRTHPCSLRPQRLVLPDSSTTHRAATCQTSLSDTVTYGATVYLAAMHDIHCRAGVNRKAMVIDVLALVISAPRAEGGTLSCLHDGPVSLRCRMRLMHHVVPMLTGTTL